MMEAAVTSEIPINFYQTTRCYNPEDSHLYLFPDLEEVSSTIKPVLLDSQKTMPEIRFI
jgi:hypothetical protein